MLDVFSDGQLAALAGAFGGVLLGLAARLGGFCTLGAIEDHLYGGSSHRLRMWGLSIALSLLGVAALAALGVFDPAKSLYLASGWNPFGVVLGGVMFGLGMAQTGHCCHGALARLGGGDLRAFVIVLVIGISAYMTMSGPFASFRIWAFPETDAPMQSIAALLGAPFGLVAAPLACALALWALSNSIFRKDIKTIGWCVCIAFAITSGWGATEWIATHGFSPDASRSHNYAAPTGDTLIYVMTMSGAYIDFGIGSVFGVIAGAVAGSIYRREFRWEACEDPRELRRQLLGAFLMGTGAVISLGCSVGQGLSAFSTLAPSAPILLASIFAGAALGLRLLVDDAPFTGLLRSKS